MEDEEWEMCYQFYLVELGKRIKKIERKDSDFENNRKWKKYRTMQEMIYSKIRKDNGMEK